MSPQPDLAPQPQPPTPHVPGAHHDDSSVAGEEDPGASLEELPKPTPVTPAPSKAPVP